MPAATSEPLWILGAGVTPAARRAGDYSLIEILPHTLLGIPIGPLPWTQRFFEFCYPGVLKVLHYDSHVIEDLAQHLGIWNLVLAASTSLGQNPQGQTSAFGDELHGARYTS